MSVAATIGRGAPPLFRRLPAMAPYLAVTAVGAASLAAIVLSNGHLVAAVAPVALATVAALVWQAPLRVTLATVMFVALSVDRPGDADGHFVTPLNVVGGLLFQNLNHVVPIEALKFSGVFALLVLLLVVRLWRRLDGRVRDTAGSLLPASPLAWSLAVAVGTIAASIAFGLARGGDIQMAKIQTQAFLQLVAVAYLFSVSLRGRQDFGWLATLIVTAAGIKAALAVYVRSVLPAEFPDQWGVMRELEYVTNHGDSLLFAAAAAVVVGPLFHRPTRRQLMTLALFGPLLIAGIIANDRRIAWVQVGLVVAAFVVMNPISVPTRRLARALVLASPLLLAYTVVGWSSSSRVFAPVGFVRNLVQPVRSDGSLDRSTLFRDVENFNLVTTFMGNPVLGTGFGHPFQMAVQGDALTEFKEYMYLPHNSTVGLWAFTGLFGFTGIFACVSVAGLLALQAHRRARHADEKVVAAAVVGCLAAYAVHLWADIGFSEAPTIFLVGLALALAGQVATATGAWPYPDAPSNRASQPTTRVYA